ncbi:hypothetical protein FISHEDRAFT_67851 [Fistulina hepatica ATCC 64428]|nr:hypothetical protein FISHEDRAFT_67851 [Fistulina hepatica ATCC 64428]
MSDVERPRVARVSSPSFSGVSTSSRRRPRIPHALSQTHVAEALSRSTDKGLTLVFSKLYVTEVSDGAVEDLASRGKDDGRPVERMSLASNHISTLPMDFALLSRLRYLNLKSNALTEFPQVLTLMPSLEILDVGHNKIRRMPADPGDLVNLRVLCLSKNKVTKIPAYITRFQALRHLQVDRNPIEWPPKFVMEPIVKPETEEAMVDWIRSIQKWIRADLPRKLTPESISSLVAHATTSDDSFGPWSRLPANDHELEAGVTPHARSFSIESASSYAESFQEVTRPPSERPPPLHLGILQSYTEELSPTRSYESYLPSPADSISFFEEEDDPEHQHVRHASYAPSGSGGTLKDSTLSGKKSMPDLRTARLDFTKKTPTGSTQSLQPTQQDYVSSRASPSTSRQDSGSSSSSRGITRARGHVSPTPPVPAFKDAPSTMAFERNSYFRRISNFDLLSSVTSISQPMLALIDCARSILFAVVQIHLALERYTIHPIDERLASLLRKVAEPAQSDMMNLLCALDQFDAMSRKGNPPAAVCRSVVESCRHTVAAFGKVISVLPLQLKVINTDDIRFLRSMILVLYGAAAEISAAWQALIPQLDAIRPLLYARPYPSPSPSLSLITESLHETAPTPASAQDLPLHTPTLRSHSNNPSGVSLHRNHTARRHAGSFSSKDVELGKQMPSVDLPPPPRLRSVSRQGTSNTNRSASPVNGYPLPPPFAPVSDSAHILHSRHGSQASLQNSSPTSSPSVAQKTFELPSSSKVVDQAAITAVRQVVNVAPVVWDMIQDVMADELQIMPDVVKNLETGRAVTRRLRGLVLQLQGSDPSVDRKALREDAHLFLKSVVQLSNFVKTYAGDRPQTSSLRSQMVELTNATTDFAILFKVSNLSSAPSRPQLLESPVQSPALPPIGAEPPFLGLPRDHRLARSLSRSQSIHQRSPSARTVLDPPRSAQPGMQFHVPTLRRTRTEMS